MMLTRSVDYAMRSLMHLAQVPPGQVEPLDAIAKAQRIPGALLSKILQSLVRAGIVRSKKGYGGGYSLLADPRTLTVRSVVELVDGPFTVFECLVDLEFCTLCEHCKLRACFVDLQNTMLERLESTTLFDLLPDPPAEVAGAAVAEAVVSESAATEA